MTHGSLFSGIGGFDLAAEWMNWENLFHCEINLFCNKVLNYYWPNAKSYTDIKQADFSIWRGRIDVISGGFPCQPYSVTGRRKGKEDDRHLWPEMLRAIREIQPRYIVGENVPGIVNWSKGLVFDEVQTDLENEGYVTQAYILPACGIGAIHRRERVWFVAYADSNAEMVQGRYGNSGNKKWHSETQIQERENKFVGSGKPTCENDTNSDQERDKGKFAGIGHEQRKMEKPIETFSFGAGWYATSDGVSKPTIVSRNDGISIDLDGITFSKWREESTSAFGNAIVPQVVHQIFKSIEQYELTNANA